MFGGWRLPRRPCIPRRKSAFGPAEIAAVVRSMKATHFQKSMTSYRDHRRWQDVYNVPHEAFVLYVKFTDDGGGVFTILSFKEK